MGSALEIGIKIRKFVVISIKEGYRSACNHPFLLGFLCFLLLLYRSFPFLFSVLVSASPVLVCTAVLLGTLLSFGQPNVPEVEKEEKVTHGISSFQTGFSEGNTFVAERDASYFVKGYSENKSDIEESGIEEASLVGEKENRVEEDPGLLSDLPTDGENLQDVQSEKQVRGEADREFHSFELGNNREVNEENLRSEGVSSDDEAIEKQYVMVQNANDDILEIENEKTVGDHMDFSPSSSWKQVENNHDEDDSVESGSDEAESSSPDASMADIMPMLDELHPLLDADAPQPAHLSRDGSDAASDKSQKSDDDSVESDEDTENHCDAEDDGVDEHDDEEEEETEGGKEDESKSAIKWTEDDQKNLMDLGTLELERNQRLENLIARRRARRLMTEKNLIDLDCADLPVNVAPITTTRRNPFDLPDDSYASMGLPPIPGSAPSILQPRRNPFDIPYDPNEEKPDLKGDSFQQEFTMFNQKDAFFRRHESFSLGPSVLGMSRQERYDINWKPVFISERMASEGTSYSPFQRQSSEVSDSKLSSVLDTESVSSIDQDERKFSEQDLSQEAESISNIDQASDDAEHGSHTSGDNDSVGMIQVEERNIRHDEAEIVLGGVENPSEMEFYPETGEVEIHEQFNAGETHLRREPSEEESSSSISSHSSHSEVINNIPDEKMEKMENLPQGDGHLPESTISTQASEEESNFHHVSSEVEDNQHIEPVYDSSPPAAEKLLSFPSVSSDSATEFSDTVLPPAAAEVTATVADKESEEHDHRLEVNSGHEETQVASSEPHMEVKNELRSEKSEDIGQHNVTSNELSAVASNSVDQSGSTVAEFHDVPVSVDSHLPSDIGSVKDVPNSDLVHGEGLAEHADSEIHHQDNVDSPDSNYQMASEKSLLSDTESGEEVALPNEVSRFDNANLSGPLQDADEKLNLVVSSAHDISSNGSSMHVTQDLQQAPVVNPNLPSEETEYKEKNSAEQAGTDIHHDINKNMVSFTSDSQHEIDLKSSKLENRLSSSDKLEDHDEIQSSDAIRVESAQGFGYSNDGVGESRDAINKIPPRISSVTSEKFETPLLGSPTGEVYLEVDRHGEVKNEAPENSVPSEEGYVSQVSEENMNGFDDVKEIEEGFLSELDTVGDFRVSDASVSHHTDIEKTTNAQVSSLPKDVKIAEVEQDIPVLEARSLEDINLVFKQLQEGADVKEVILPSSIKDQHVNQESKDHPEVNSDLQVVEARSVEDIDNALKPTSESNREELETPSALKDESVKIGSPKVTESFDVATSTEETSTSPVDKLENVPIGSSSNEVKSHSRKSSSSSSSSDSD